MRSTQLLVAAVVAGATLALVLSRTAPAQDPAVVNKTVHVRLDNPRVRVLEATLAPRQREQMHSHPAYVIYVITGGTVRNHAADGTTSEATLHDGDVVYRDPLTHWAENIGTTSIHLMLVELKDAH